ncbi:hypothetical protein DE146DRAFT_147414 [Phaeosphaeria sp. MPI-PUGE-AT-0046c]|nr:hypothetical protein DE146DRAFT_147414 [Phaeosphaeria sp. MPI-PUGE-AT-0046c]
MSVMEYDVGRRYSSRNNLNLSYLDYYYDDCNTSMALSLGARADPRGYAMGGPVGGHRNRHDTDREEQTFDSVHSRRRIAVACARCRKRKIKCSGDPGNGTGCNACKAAGVDLSSCQFHRVGSDSNVTKVMDNYHIAQSLTGMANPDYMPMFSPTARDSLYPRPLLSQTYPPLDTKPTWAMPYSEESSPIETYGLDQASTYLPEPASMSAVEMFPPSYRWTYPAARPPQQTPNAFYGNCFTPHGLPCLPPTDLSSFPIAEPPSPMSMSSLRATLPEKPHPRQLRVSSGVVPQRQLPFPQPSSAQTSRNVLDSLQDQRLRAGQTGVASHIGSTAVYAKPSLPWHPSNATHAVAVESTPIDAETSAQDSAPVQGVLNFLAATAIDGSTAATTNAPQLELNFTTPTLLEAITAPTKTSPYSNFRENRAYSQSTVKRRGSQAGSYSFRPSDSSKRSSTSSDDTEERTLTSGRRYTPLTPLQPQPSTTPESLQREPFDKRSTPLHRGSMSKLNTSF